MKDKNWVTLAVLTSLIGCASPAPPVNRQLCFAMDPDVAIGGCTAIIQSGQASQTDLAIIFNTRGTGYGRKEQYDLAIQDFDQAIRLNPNLDPAFFNRGMAYRAKGQRERARDDYDQAIRLNPDQPLYRAAKDHVTSQSKSNRPPQ